MSCGVKDNHKKSRMTRNTGMEYVRDLLLKVYFLLRVWMDEGLHTWVHKLFQPFTGQNKATQVFPLMTQLNHPLLIPTWCILRAKIYQSCWPFQHSSIPASHALFPDIKNANLYIFLYLQTFSKSTPSHTHSKPLTSLVQWCSSSSPGHKKLKSAHQTHHFPHELQSMGRPVSSRLLGSWTTLQSHI